MASTSLANLMRDLEQRQKNNEKAETGVVKMYNPEKRFGFVHMTAERKDIHFKLDTVLKSGFSADELKLGAKVTVITWHIQHIGPEVKRFISIEQPAPKTNGVKPPVVLVQAPALPPPAPKLEELKDEFGHSGRKHVLYPGGTDQLLIDYLAKSKIGTREELKALFVKTGYNKNSVNSTLSRVHARGWFIENGGKLYFRQGRPPEK